MRFLFLSLLVFFSLTTYAQSISPSIISIRKPRKAVPEPKPIDSTKVDYGPDGRPVYGGLNEVSVIVVRKEKWFLPFRQSDSALAKAYDKEGSKFSGLSSVSIRPSIDTSAASSMFVEFFSIIPSKYFRIGVGSNLVKSAVKDSATSNQEIAFQKLTNGGGNLVLNLNRPLIYLGNLAASKKGFFVTNIDVSFYADVENVNRDIYNPGWGCLSNLSADFRIINQEASARSGQEGNLFRFGLNARHQFNVFNEKYNLKNNLNNNFNNLSITSVGAYLGLAMFNLQLNYNTYNKSDKFFEDKKWQLRVEIVPVKF